MWIHACSIAVRNDVECSVATWMIRVQSFHFPTQRRKCSKMRSLLGFLREKNAARTITLSPSTCPNRRNDTNDSLKQRSRQTSHVLTATATLAKTTDFRS